jgi:hypothetical protein
MALRDPTARPLAHDSWGMLENALQRFERQGKRGGKGVILATPLRKRSVVMCPDSSLHLGVFSFCGRWEGIHRRVTGDCNHVAST